MNLHLPKNSFLDIVDRQSGNIFAHHRVVAEEYIMSVQHVKNVCRFFLELAMAVHAIMS